MATNRRIAILGAGKIGEALLRAAFATFRGRDVATVMLNVDRDNTTGATRLYERAGMRLRRRWLVVAKTLTAP